MLVYRKRKMYKTNKKTVHEIFNKTNKKYIFSNRKKSTPKKKLKQKIF